MYIYIYIYIYITYSRGVGQVIKCRADGVIYISRLNGEIDSIKLLAVLLMSISNFFNLTLSLQGPHVKSSLVRGVL